MIKPRLVYTACDSGDPWDWADCARSHPITLLAYLAANRRAASLAIGSFLL
jgi:hypothetical protein